MGLRERRDHAAPCSIADAKPWTSTTVGFVLAGGAFDGDCGGASDDASPFASGFALDSGAAVSGSPVSM